MTHYIEKDEPVTYCGKYHSEPPGDGATTNLLKVDCPECVEMLQTTWKVFLHSLPPEDDVYMDTILRMVPKIERKWATL